jgi:hypothetical protein
MAAVTPSAIPTAVSNTTAAASAAGDDRPSAALGQRE